MKRPGHRVRFAAGISLVETIVSVGVLAIVIPLAMAAMLKATGSGVLARGETRAPAIAEYCLVELRAAREGVSNYFEPIEVGMDFGEGDEFMALGFGRDGAILGKVSQAEFENGLSKLGGEQVYYLARLSGKLDTVTREVDLVTVAVDVEYPAVQSSQKRSSVSFYTKLP